VAFGGAQKVGRGPSGDLKSAWSKNGGKKMRKKGWTLGYEKKGAQSWEERGGRAGISQQTRKSRKNSEIIKKLKEDERKYIRGDFNEKRKVRRGNVRKQERQADGRQSSSSEKTNQ